MNRRVDIGEDIERYQDTLSYVSGKVDYSVGQNIYMLPGDMNLKIRLGTVGYNKILVSNEKFSLEKNQNVNASLAKPEEEALVLAPCSVVGPCYTETTKNSHKNRLQFIKWQ